jgi:hypothetical protein
MAPIPAGFERVLVISTRWLNADHECGQLWPSPLKVSRLVCFPSLLIE